MSLLSFPTKTTLCFYDSSTTAVTDIVCWARHELQLQLSAWQRHQKIFFFDFPGVPWGVWFSCDMQRHNYSLSLSSPDPLCFTKLVETYLVLTILFSGQTQVKFSHHCSPLRYKCTWYTHTHTHAHSHTHTLTHTLTLTHALYLRLIFSGSLDKKMKTKA